MLTWNAYPFASYVPNKISAAIFASIVALSLTFWFFQSIQNRFFPPRISFLLGVSHLTIFIELILRAAIDPLAQDSRIIFTVISTLLVAGQRMIIVANFVFVFIIRRKKSRYFLIGVIFCVVTSGILMSPATLFSFDQDHIKMSYIFRILSASILFLVTISFYFVWFYSQTWNEMTRSGRVLMIISSSACFIAALYNLVQSFPNTYEKINSNEIWFYAFQMTPIIVAHCTWSINHPKRTLRYLPPSFPLLTTDLQ